MDPRFATLLGYTPVGGRAGRWLDGDPPVFYVGVNYDTRPARYRRFAGRICVIHRRAF